MNSIFVTTVQGRRGWYMFRRRIRSLVFDASQSVPLSRPSSGAMRRSAVSPLSALPFLFSISFFFSLCASERVAASLNLSFCAYLSSPFFRFFPLVTLAFPKVSSSIKVVFLFPLFLFIFPFCLSYKPFCDAFLCNIDSFCFLFEFVGFSVIFSFLTCFYRFFSHFESQSFHFHAFYLSNFLSCFFNIWPVQESFCIWTSFASLHWICWWNCLEQNF